MTLLERIATEGLTRRLDGNVGPEYRERLREELDLIEEMGFVDYFLICYDIVRAARAKGIRTTGRGSAGNSLVAFALDIVGPDPLVHGMIFQRFMNRERRELPDIDVDFCSRRRDEVLDYVYERYGKDRVAAVATLNTFRARSAVRDVAKALGYSPEEIDDIARVFPFLSSSGLMASWENTPEIRNCRVDLGAVAEVVAIADRIAGFPRHLGIHVGGIVISDRELTDYVPLQQSTKGIVICQYDKDDVEALGLVKLDLLGLRMHSAIERCLDLVERGTGTRPDIDRVPLNDEATYQLMREARTVGCFQLESPGERSLQTRLLPLVFRDVIANISLFRPGPVQADMVSPFVERRHGRQEIPWIHPRLESILGETYGVVTYQEQVLLIANEIAGFSLAEADSLRRAMTKSISAEDLEAIKRRFIQGALASGVSREDAESIFRQIAGFAAYGFCKGHAACFGLIAYQSAYLKAHHPAEFLAGVLSNEPMGYYSARTIVEDAKRCGVQVLRVDVNASEEQYSVENGAIRIGLLQVAGLSEASQRSIVEGRLARPYESLLDFCGRARVDRDALENLVLAGAFDDLPAYSPEPRPPFIWLSSGATDKHPLVPVRADALDHRRRLIWLLPLIVEAAGVSDDGQVSISEVGPDLKKLDLELLGAPAPSPACGRDDAGKMPALPVRIEKDLILADYQAIHLSPLRHPVALVRPMLRERRCITSLELLDAKTGSRARAGGVVVSRNRPPTKSGRIVVFVTMEDEMGLFDAVVFENAYYRLRSIIFGHDTLIVEGRIDRQSGTAVSLIVDGAEPLNPFERPVEGLLPVGPGDHSQVKLLRERVHPTEADQPAYA